MVCRLMPRPDGEICLRVHVHAQDAVALFGERTREIDGRRRLADAALLVGDGDDVGHRGITSNPGWRLESRRRGRERGQATTADAVHAQSGYPHDDASCSPILWIVLAAAMMDALSVREDADRDVGGSRTTVTTNDERLARLDAMRARGAARRRGRTRIEQQHARGKLTARERLELLLDPESFVELDAFVTHRATDFGLDRSAILGDGVVTGHGTIDGRLVFVFSQDFTVFGGSLSEAHAEKICKVMDLAMKVGAPIIGLNDSGGARIQEGVVSLGGYADIFLRNTLGVRGRAADLADPGAVRRRRGLLAGDHGLHDHGRGDQLHVRDRPRGREGGDPRGCRLASTWVARAIHTTRSAASRTSPRRDEADGGRAARARSWRTCRRTTSATRRGATTTTRPTARRRAGHVIPDDPTQPYDMHDVIERIVDDGEFLEIQPALGANILIGFARLDGRSVGIVAQQPAVLAGALDIDASTRPRGSSAPATLQRAAADASSTCPDSCPASPRSTAGSSATARSCCTPTARRPCPR